jgi:ATP-dependent Lon protease
MPVLPLRDAVVFPNMVIPLFIGRPKSISAIEVAFVDNNDLLLVAQKDSLIDKVYPNDLYTTGTICNISQVIKLADNTIKVLIEGKARGVTKKITENDYMFFASVVSVEEEEALSDKNVEALRLAALSRFELFMKNSKKVSEEAYDVLFSIESPSKLADNMASYMPFKISEKQTLLEEFSVAKRLEKLIVLIESQNELLQVEKKIKTRVKKQVEKNQKEYYLNEQLKAIHKELGDPDSVSEFNELTKKIEKKHMPAEVTEKALAEVKKLKNMPPLSQEGGIIRNYLEWLCNIPWIPSKEKMTLERAEEILNKSHYGLAKIKERIMEYLAVQQRVKKMKAQIMCFVGPPGVGKTSLGQAIATATNKSFVRISLGGVNDEAEIRGHRKTYIGAMPGKIIQAMKRAGVTNPVIMLDEIDKLGMDWRGDPASALLEVLDPEQNSSFMDHYIEVPYDLSDVMFITTANSMDIPHPLLDRMETIALSGYTDEEKLNIAKFHIISKQQEENGLLEGELTFTDDSLYSIIRDYTKESGVRNLERSIAKISRKSVRKILTESDTKKMNVTKDNIKDFLGPPKYSFLELQKNDTIGVVTGLAWTEMGGDLLSIESLLFPGTGNIISTGHLGDVMQESIKAAYSYVKSQTSAFDIDPEVFSKNDVHIHVPEGAVPKDGPSAGVTICTAIVSAVTKKKVKCDIAMTGEITLLGKVLGIGGLKEKLLAAKRGAIRTVFIPKENEKDLIDMPQNLLAEIDVKCVGHINEILESSFR